VYRRTRRRSTTLQRLMRPPSTMPRRPTRQRNTIPPRARLRRRRRRPSKAGRSGLAGVRRRATRPSTRPQTPSKKVRTRRADGRRPRKTRRADKLAASFWPLSSCTKLMSGVVLLQCSIAQMLIGQCYVWSTARVSAGDSVAESFVRP
jgi:hypothetical protein